MSIDTDGRVTEGPLSRRPAEAAVLRVFDGLATGRVQAPPGTEPIPAGPQLPVITGNPATAQATLTDDKKMMATLGRS